MSAFSRKKVLSSGIGVLLFAQSSFASLGELSVWEERRVFLSQNRKKNTPVGLASLPKNYQGGFPEIGALPSIQSIVNKSIKKWFPKHSNAKIESIIKSLSLKYGSIRDVNIPPKADKFVIHIQDIHMNKEAQENIGGVVQELIDHNQVDIVALEGAFDVIDLSRFRESPYQTYIQKMATYLFKEKKISGPIHTAFMSENKIPPFIGVDDRTHYEANVEAYRQSIKHKGGPRDGLKSNGSKNSGGEKNALKQSIKTI